MSGHVSGAASGHHSGHDDKSYLLYSDPNLPGVLPAVLSENIVDQYEPIFPSKHSKAYTEIEVESGEEHHDRTFSQTALDKFKSTASFIWNGGNTHHSEEGHH